MLIRTDTIAAIATAPGTGAIGIVRFTGAESLVLLNRLVPGNRAAQKPRVLALGRVIDPGNGELIDDALCVYFPAPHTYTGEDMVELHGHGGSVVLGRILRAGLAAGAVTAEPGEFTYRAYHHGRLDLLQVEAVMGLIGARSDRAAAFAASQLEGNLGRRIDNLLQEIVMVSAAVEAALDYPDEDLPPRVVEDQVRRLESTASQLRELSDSYGLGARLTLGAAVAIIGPPNAGKSSLLNRLAGEDRAIVDAESGTTRDVVEVAGQIQGISIRYLDTAGLREAAGRVERLGIDKTRKVLRDADLVLYVVDGTAPIWEVSDDIRQRPQGSTILVANKMDLPNWREPNLTVNAAIIDRMIPICALTGVGICALEEAIYRALVGGGKFESEMLTTARQNEAVALCREHLNRAIAQLTTAGESEIVAEELRLARNALSSLWGRTTTDDVLNTIFSTFCLGK